MNGEEKQEQDVLDFNASYEKYRKIKKMVQDIAIQDKMVEKEVWEHKLGTDNWREGCMFFEVDGETFAGNEIERILNSQDKKEVGEETLKEIIRTKINIQKRKESEKKAAAREDFRSELDSMEGDEK